RRRHTRFSRDWSSDVCSSDLVTTISDLIQNKYSSRDNGDQVTILPSALFELIDGKLIMVSDDEMLSLLEQTKTNVDTVVNVINEIGRATCREREEIENERESQ